MKLDEVRVGMKVTYAGKVHTVNDVSHPLSMKERDPLYPSIVKRVWLDGVKGFVLAEDLGRAEG